MFAITNSILFVFVAIAVVLIEEFTVIVNYATQRLILLFEENILLSVTVILMALITIVIQYLIYLLNVIRFTNVATEREFTRAPTEFVDLSELSETTSDTTVDTVDITNVRPFDNTPVKQQKHLIITDDEYNQLLFDAVIHIWKKYQTQTQNDEPSQWYHKVNEEDVKYIIGELLPDRLLEQNRLFVEYKGQLITTVPDDIYNELVVARKNRLHISNIIKGVYKKIKNSYRNGITEAIIDF